MSDMNLRMKVATAAKLAGVPVRSLFRAVKARRVPSTTENGVAMVMLADVRKWNATRNASADDDPDPDTMEAPMDAAASGSDSDNGTGSAVAPPPVAPPLVEAVDAPSGLVPEPGAPGMPSTPPIEPAVATPAGFKPRAFALFDAGVGPHKAVEQMQAEPALVKAAFKEYREMLELAGTVPSTLVGHIMAQADRFENVALDAAAATQALRADVHSLLSRLQGLERAYAELSQMVTYLAHRR